MNCLCIYNSNNNHSNECILILSFMYLIGYLNWRGIILSCPNKWLFSELLGLVPLSNGGFPGYLCKYIFTRTVVLHPIYILNIICPAGYIFICTITSISVVLDLVLGVFGINYFYQTNVLEFFLKILCLEPEPWWVMLYHLLTIALLLHPDCFPPTPTSIIFFVILIPVFGIWGVSTEP